MRPGSTTARHDTRQRQRGSGPQDRRVRRQAGPVPRRARRPCEPGPIAAWIAENEAEKASYALVTRRYTPRHRITEAEIKAIVDKLAGIALVLQDADPDDKVEVCRQLGLKLRYHPGRRLWKPRSRLLIRISTVSEDRHAPYVHERHCPDQGVFAYCRRCAMSGGDRVIRWSTTFAVIGVAVASYARTAWPALMTPWVADAPAQPRPHQPPDTGRHGCPVTSWVNKTVQSQIGFGVAQRLALVRVGRPLPRGNSSSRRT